MRPCNVEEGKRGVFVQQDETLEARKISFGYRERQILRDVSFIISPGERAALVGPSGCGKSTLAKILAGYLKPSGGAALWGGEPLPSGGYCPVQMIQQHPEAAVDPRWKMERILKEGGMPASDVLQAMGIEREWLTRWPSELSGGELQRFCIARVLREETRFLICDEISTMLDAITQAQVWHSLLAMSEGYGFGMLVITHNIELAKQVCDRILEWKDLTS